ncbi:hypothetical protein J1N35_011444 [Gossypium stocksii]|uniref:Uncharacterized protein n=1 Tax=Gossypium stocksii TaxID=47602 RepID=A0A9D3W2H7_9ROSI|nr:hypothetical protein J1N35_011444 [Gossypium stocksii]
MFFRALELSMGEEGSSNKVMTVVLTESGQGASTSKFKRRMVLAVRDFPLGRGRVTAPRSKSSANAQEFLVLYVIRCVKGYLK